MSDIPAYSAAGLDALDSFYQDYVAAIFFFEDEHHEAVYERIIFRLIPKIKSFQVICLGGKAKVIAKAKERRPPGAKWLFVLDKDYDDLLGSVFVRDGVYYLRSFSLENYLVDLAGIVRLAVEMRPRELTFQTAVARCTLYPTFLTRLTRQLEKIGRLFVVARRHRVEIQTTKLSVDELLVGADEDQPIPTDDWYSSYLQRFRNSLPGGAEWLAENEALDSEVARAFERDPRCEFPDIEKVDHLCGKHLLGCVLRACQSWLEVRFVQLDVVELYARLAAQVDLRRLSYLAEAMVRDQPELVRA